MDNLRIKERLVALSSQRLKDFNTVIIPTGKQKIGVTIPALRMLAKEFSSDVEKFLGEIKFDSFEEIMLYGIVIGSADIPVNDRLILIDKYLPLCDNWAHIDCAVSSYKFIRKNRELVMPYLKSKLFGSEYEVRFALVAFLFNYVSEEYLSTIFNVLDNVNNSPYYVSMASAWLIAECYIKFPKETQKWLKTCKIDGITYNRAIQKICDSKRVDKPEKDILKKTKRKV